jgi:hypothetical protein
MPRNHKANEIVKIARAKRQSALERKEFSYPSEARVSADSPTSFAVKDVDAGTAAMIADFLAKRGQV